MKLLALDTATEACSLALYHEGAVLARFENAGRSHTERLLPLFQSLLAESGLRFAQLDGLVCGIGPGSFAGVRIGVGFAKGLALARDLPVVGVSSLAMLAQAALDAGAQRALAVIDARMGEVYHGAYQRDAQGLAQLADEPGVCAPDALPAPAAGDWHCVGTGWGTYPQMLDAAPGIHRVQIDGTALPDARAALRLALPQFEAGTAASGDALAPLYLRNKVALTLIEQAQLRADLKARNSG